MLTEVQRSAKEENRNVRRVKRKDKKEDAEKKEGAEKKEDVEKREI